MASTFGDLGFRDLVGRLVVVEYPMLDRLGDSGLVIPAGADSVLAYPYIDHQCGLTLFSLAPASLACGEIYHDASFPVVQRAPLLLRSGSVASEARAVIPDDEESLAERYAEQIAYVERVYDPGPGVVATRAIERVDSLRNREFPDDVFVLLSSEGLQTEGVWFRLEGLAGDDMLAGALLNEPDDNYPVHVGDLMALGLVVSRDGSTVLATVPDLIISPVEG